MTEDQWLTSTCLWDMFQLLRNQPGAQRLKAWRRKFRLWGCACCRLHGKDLADHRIRNAVEVAERHADGPVPATELEKARQGVSRALHEREEALGFSRALERLSKPDALQAAQLLLYPQWGNFAWAGMAAAHGCVGINKPRAKDCPYADLMRDIFGNPFRPVKVERAWLNWNSGAVGAIAEGVHAERAFDRLPVLADALEDAGCQDEALLSHLRNAGPHAYGCWAVDALLGKAPTMAHDGGSVG